MIPFNDLKPLQRYLSSEISEAVQRVLDRGWFILGPELEAFETAFTTYHGVNHAVGVANGTDAIELALRAVGVGPGDEVITVSHTAVATVCAVERTGARPVLVDIDPDTYTIDPVAAAAAITSRTKVLLPVHLYGQPADMATIVELANRHHLLVIEDCAQAHGARFGGRLAGTFGHLSTFSFYPTKNLGAYGDGGAVITNDPALDQKLRLLRNYGQTSRYTHVERGVNSRLDELQAAILQVKLAHLDEINAIRRSLASQYNQELVGVYTPLKHPLAQHVYHLYVIRHPRRDELAKALGELGIGTLIHYPIPIHQQVAYQDLGYPDGSLPNTETIARQILSLPMYYGLTPVDISQVAQAVRQCIARIDN